MTSSGTRQHCVYPVPDSAFVWHQLKTMVATRSHAAPSQDPIPDHDMSMESPREATISKLTKELAEYHHLHGHRSADHTSRMYEFENSCRLPPEVIAAQKPCLACDTAKIVSKSNQKTRVVPITEVGSDIAADTLVSMPRSVSGFYHVALTLMTFSQISVKLSASPKH